ESLQQLLGVDRSNAPDHARGKVLLDAIDGGRGRGLEEPGLELLTMSAIIRPVTRGRDPLARRNYRRMSNDRDEIAVASGLHPDDAEAVLGVLIGDAFNQSSKDLPVGWQWLRLHDLHRTGPVAKTLASGTEVRRNLAPLGAPPQAARSYRRAVA